MTKPEPRAVPPAPSPLWATMVATDGISAWATAATVPWAPAGSRLVLTLSGAEVGDPDEVPLRVTAVTSAAVATPATSSQAVARSSGGGRRRRRRGVGSGPGVHGSPVAGDGSAWGGGPGGHASPGGWTSPSQGAGVGVGVVVLMSHTMREPAESALGETSEIAVSRRLGVKAGSSAGPQRDRSRGFLLRCGLGNRRGLPGVLLSLSLSAFPGFVGRVLVRVERAGARRGRRGG